MPSEANTSPETPQLLQAMEEKIATQKDMEVSEAVDTVEAKVRTSLFGISLPGTLFCPARAITENENLRQQAANDNDPSLIKENKKAA